MRPFLSDDRRRRLMSDLLGLGVPAAIATEIVFMPDQTDAVDYEMAFRCRRIILNAEEIHKVGDCDVNRLFQLSSYLAADLLTIGVFKAEAVSRGGLQPFVHWLEASRFLVIQ